MRNGRRNSIYVFSFSILYDLEKEKGNAMSFFHFQFQMRNEWKKEKWFPFPIFVLYELRIGKGKRE